METSDPSPDRPDADLRVLVVDDDPGDRWYFSELLRARGYAVLSCGDAETAWDVYQTTPTPLVLLDLHLPGMHGTELCRRIKDHPRGAETVVMAVTGSTEPAAVERILAAGADDFLGKPVDPELLGLRLVIAQGRIRTERHRARSRAAFDATRRELEALVERLPDVFFSLDPREERLVRVSAAARAVLGHEPEELVGAPDLWQRLLLGGVGGADFLTSLAAGDEGSAVAGEPPVSGAHALDADGARRHLRTYLWIERDADGVPVRVDGVVRDVTSGKRTDEALERRNRDVAAVARLAEMTTADASDDEGLEEMVSEIASVLGVPWASVELRAADEPQQLRPATLHGFGPAEPRGGTPIRATRGGLVARAVRDQVPVLETDPRVIADEGPPYLPDSGEVGFLLALPLQAGVDALGALILMGAVGTRLASGERELARTMANLVAARVERMEAERGLRKKEAGHRALVAKLSQANTELEAFAYSISHDLRAPLRTMQGFAHTLLRDHGASLTEGARDCARRILASGNQAEKLIGDLLEYSRVSFEELEIRPVELTEVVEAARQQVETRIRESGARLRVEESLPAVQGSRTILVQVVANLLSNATKFVPEARTPEIRLHVEELDDIARLWVEDNGVGVPPDQAEKIFRVFERLHHADDHPGTGIGLAIVRRGVQRIGGRVGVEPNASGGAAFWIELPLASRPGSPPATSRSAGPARA